MDSWTRGLVDSEREERIANSEENLFLGESWTAPSRGFNCSFSPLSSSLHFYSCWPVNSIVLASAYRKGITLTYTLWLAHSNEEASIATSKGRMMKRSEIKWIPFIEMSYTQRQTHFEFAIFFLFSLSLSLSLSFSWLFYSLSVLWLIECQWVRTGPKMWSSLSLSFSLCTLYSPLSRAKRNGPFSLLFTSIVMFLFHFSLNFTSAFLSPLFAPLPHPLRFKVKKVKKKNKK